MTIETAQAEVVREAAISIEAGDARARSGDFLFYGLLVYIIMFYSQFAGRIPLLAPLRLELVLGSIILIGSLARVFGGRGLFGENKLNLAALAFISVAALTVPFALVKTRALYAFVDLLKFFAIYYMIVAAIDSEEKLKKFVYVYLAMIALLFVEPFLLSLQGAGFIYNNHMMRLAGVTNYFGHPNQLGGITAENIPFFYYLAKCQRSRLVKVALLLLIPVALRVIMLTQSRTAFVTVICFGGIVWLMSKRKLLGIVALIIVGTLLWQVAPDQTKERFMTFTRVEDVMTTDRSEFSQEDRIELGSMANRWELIRRALVAFTENPILGVGVTCFISFNGMRWGYWFPPHNTYVQALAEMGIIGFGVFVWVLIVTLKNLAYARGVWKKRGEEKSFMGYLTLAVTVYLLLRIVVAMFGQDLYANYWWIAGGLSVVIARIARAREAEAVPVSESARG